MKTLHLTPVPVTRAILEELEAASLIRLFRPTPAVLNAPVGQSVSETLYATDPAFGPHKLIAVGINMRSVRLGSHSDGEEFLIPLYGEEVKPLYLVICKLSAAQVKERDLAGALRAEDFVCLSFYPSPRGADMFTMLAGTLHCEVTDTSEKPIGAFYVTEPRDLDMIWTDLQATEFTIGDSM